MNIIDQPDKAIDVPIYPLSYLVNLYLIAQEALEKWYSSPIIAANTKFNSKQ